MLEFMNIFLIPFIALNIIYKRENTEKKLDATFVTRYALCVIAVYVCTYALMTIATLAIGIGANSTSNLYSLAAIVVAFIIPYAHEILSKYVDISFETKANKK